MDSVMNPQQSIQVPLRPIDEMPTPNLFASASPVAAGPSGPAESQVAVPQEPIAMPETTGADNEAPMTAIEQMKALIADAQARRDEDPQLAALKGDIERFQSQPAGINFSAGLALADTLTGSNLSQMLKGQQPMSQEERDLVAIRSKSDLLEKLDKIGMARDQNLQSLQADLAGLLNQRELAQLKNDTVKSIADQKAAILADKPVKSPFWDKIDSKAADQAIAWQENRAGIYNDIAKLKQQKQILEDFVKGKKGSSSTTGFIKGRLPDFLKEIVAPDLKNMRDVIASVTQKDLRRVLGGQFAQKEGEQLLKRAFDENIDEKYNIARLTDLINAMEYAAKQKDINLIHTASSGTLRGRGIDVTKPASLATPSSVDISIDDEIEAIQKELGM